MRPQRHCCEAFRETRDNPSWTCFERLHVEPGHSIGPQRLAEHFVFFCPRRKQRGNCAGRLGERREPILERYLLLETTPFAHGALFPFQRKAGAQQAFTSPIRAKGGAVMQDQYTSSKS